MQSRWIKLLICFMVMSFGEKVYALAVDEKLPVRILKVSKSKKTILLNRGVEDGLVVGDHAKFFLTTGVVARGVLIKSSPTRSVWAVYRLLSEEEIAAEKVMSLKITTAVKLTNDPTKIFSDEGSSAEVPEGVILAEGADDEDKDLSTEERKELIKLKEKMIASAPTLSRRTWEAWGMIHLSSLSTTNSTSPDSESTSGNTSSINLLGGIEKYFQDYSKWYGKFSFYPFIHFAKNEYTSILGHTISSSTFGYGLGVNWNFLAAPLSVEKLIAHFGAALGGGSSTDVTTFDKTEITSDGLTLVQGRTSFYSVGGGVRYFSSSGLGVKALVDYYQRYEEYATDDLSDYTKIVKGPRILLGLSYRL